MYLHHCLCTRHRTWSLFQAGSYCLVRNSISDIWKINDAKNFGTHNILWRSLLWNIDIVYHFLNDSLSWLSRPKTFINKKTAKSWWNMSRVINGCAWYQGNSCKSSPGCFSMTNECWPHLDDDYCSKPEWLDIIHESIHRDILVGTEWSHSQAVKKH